MYSSSVPRNMKKQMSPCLSQSNSSGSSRSDMPSAFRVCRAASFTLGFVCLEVYETLVALTAVQRTADGKAVKVGNEEEVSTQA